jgi:predicted SAM-dependent methyltransferase
MGVRLDLGGGTKKTAAPGHINIDLTEDADIKWDLNKGLPADSRIWTDEFSRVSKPAIEGIRCHQVLEHLREVIPLMNDCFNVLKPGGLMEISVPLAGTDAFWQDPTHVRGWILRTFDYFCDDPTTKDAREEYGITARFERVWDLLEHGWNLQVHLRKPEK